MKKYIDPKYLEISNLPKKVKISTISATCSLNVGVKLNNIYKYMKLDHKGIYTIKFKNKVKSLEPQKKKKKKKNCFQNQMTVEISPDLKDYPNSKISLKIFKNGSIQMSGIKSIEACNTVLNKLIKELGKEYGVIENNEVVDIDFIDSKTDEAGNEIKVEEISIEKFKIDMINSGFELQYNVNRENLYNKLLESRIDCKYEPSIHAGVNIKFLPKGNEKKVSIFIFESGNIIITGAKNINNILESYEYISKFVEENKSEIEKSKICELLRKNINEELNEMIKVDEDEDLFKLALSEMI